MLLTDAEYRVLIMEAFQSAIMLNGGDNRLIDVLVGARVEVALVAITLDVGMIGIIAPLQVLVGRGDNDSIHRLDIGKLAIIGLRNVLAEEIKVLGGSSSPVSAAEFTCP